MSTTRSHDLRTGSNQLTLAASACCLTLLVATRVAAHPDGAGASPPGSCVDAAPSTDPASVDRLLAQRAVFARPGADRFGHPPPHPNGPEPLLVIRIGFSDASPTTSAAQWSDHIFGPTRASLRSYYADVSNGRYLLVPAAETHGVPGDGIVTVSLPYPNPNPAPQSAAERAVLAEALAAADPFVNYAQYAGEDGLVRSHELNIVFVLNVVPHAVSGQCGESIILDGVRLLATDGDCRWLGSAAVVAESSWVEAEPYAMGIIAHELGHARFYIPDLYHQAGTTGRWGLMGESGGWGFLPGEAPGSTPGHMSAWEKIRCGFVTPIEVTPTAAGVELGVVQAVGSTFLGLPVRHNVYKISTSSPHEYFLLENREPSGYDLGLSGPGAFAGGLVVSHVNESKALGTSENHVVVEVPAGAAKHTDPSRATFALDNADASALTPFTISNTDLDFEGTFTGIEIRATSPAQPIMTALVRTVPWRCRTIGVRLRDHLMADRAIPAGYVFDGEAYALAYRSRGGGSLLGTELGAQVILHDEAPGYWVEGACGAGSGGGWCVTTWQGEYVCGTDGEPYPEGCYDDGETVICEEPVPGCTPECMICFDGVCVDP